MGTFEGVARALELLSERDAARIADAWCRREVVTVPPHPPSSPPRTRGGGHRQGVTFISTTVYTRAAMHVRSCKAPCYRARQSAEGFNRGVITMNNRESKRKPGTWYQVRGATTGEGVKVLKALVDA